MMKSLHWRTQPHIVVKITFSLFVSLFFLISSTQQVFAAGTDHGIGKTGQDKPMQQSGCAAAITVVNNNDSGAGSLRQAIIDVCPDGTITFDSDHLIFLNSRITIYQNLSIDGTGHAVIINGLGSTNLFEIYSSTVTIRNLQLSSGRMVVNRSGAISNLGGDVTILNCTLSNHTSDLENENTRYGGAIFNLGQMTIRDSTFQNNQVRHSIQAQELGGAIFNAGVLAIDSSTFINNTVSGLDGSDSYGGAIFNDSATLTITNSNFQGNSATSLLGNVGGNGGALSNSINGNLTISNTTFASNTAFFQGGAITNEGAISIKNSTFFGNSVPLGSGGALFSSGIGTINNATFSNNYASIQGAGINLNGSLTITNSIIANSSGPDCSATSSALLGTSHHNFIEDGTCLAAFSGEPYLSSSIMDLGGLTQTMALLPGSRAINAGDSLSCELADQRGVVRPQGSGCDIGAFESRGFSLAVSGGNNQSTAIETNFSNPLRVTVIANSASEPVNGGVITFNGPASGASINPITKNAVINQGDADASVTANGTPGSYSVAANSTGVDTPVSFSLTNLSASDLSISITDGLTSINPGETVNYTMTAYNNGPIDAVGASIVDTFPDALSGITYTATGTGGASGFTASGSGNINDTNLNMPSGSTITYAITGTLSASASGTLSNTATIDEPVDYIDPNMMNNIATDTTQVNEVSDLEIVVSGDATVLPGEPLIYIVDISNNGPSDAQNVLISDTYPPGTIFVSFTQLSGPSYTVSGTPSLSATIATMPAESTAQFELVLNQPADSELGWGYTNVLSISSSTIDPVPANNYDFHSISVSEQPTVVIEQAPTQLDPTNTLPLRFIATFSSPIVPGSFIANDLTVTTTASGTLTTVVTQAAPNDGTVFEIAISGLNAPGLIQVSLEEGKVQNFAGLTNIASTSTDNSVTYDNQNPLVTDISLDPLIIGKEISSFTVQFNKNVLNPPGNTEDDDVTNPNNFLLITPGVNKIFETIGCKQGLVGDDTRVTPASISYNATTFIATVHLNATLPYGKYRLLVCGSTSIVDSVGNLLNNGADMQFDFAIEPRANSLPSTGFPMGIVSKVKPQPTSAIYDDTQIQLEIPGLSVQTDVVGIPINDGNWDVTWLRNRAGWLAGSAYPTWEGNTIITGHVWDADNNPGIFWGLKDLRFGDEIFLHVGGSVYVYQVQSTKLISPDAVSSVMKHEEEDWLTLLTCEKFDPDTKTYPYRRMVRALLVEVR